MPGSIGQNLAYGYDSASDAKETKNAASAITNQWYNSEMADWTDYKATNVPSGTNFLSIGHFTQVVWKGTKKVGCATVYCDPDATSTTGQAIAHGWYTVCDYSPPGRPDVLLTA